MTRLKQGTSLVIVSLALACSAPMRPYGHPEYDLRHLRARTPRRTTPPPQAHLLVVGAIDDLTVGPIGGAYDEQNYERAPLKQTYSFDALPAKLVDALRAALLGRGLRTAKDDLDLGHRLPYRALAPVVRVLRGTIHGFSFSRHAQGFDVLLGDLSLRLIDGQTGQELWHTRQTPGFRRAWSSQDPFLAIADALAERLLSDPIFQSALSGAAT